MSQSYRRSVLDLTLGRIDAYNDAHGGGVFARRIAKGYSLFQEATGMPIARLRPVGREGLFNVLWYSHRERWEPIGDLGGVHLPLDEALEYIAKDPQGCFWH